MVLPVGIGVAPNSKNIGALSPPPSVKVLKNAPTDEGLNIGWTQLIVIQVGVVLK